ncbi:ThiF family adenylyltransferase [Cellulomonas taurus]|uniref:ThiF family adenylyltransferase n=1 Tax=Cellulomonas taurus TaxID=2729175 RepID=UPI00145D669E|nr:ThiF family adenylyltransferase [Cellulomonas taurus]
MLLRRGVRVLRIDDDQVQIGTDPRWAVRLHGLTSAQCTAVQRGADRSLRAALPESVLTELDRLGLVRAPRPHTGSMPDRLVPDCVATALVDDGDPHRVRRRRAAASVAIVGLGRTGVVIASALAGAGIGTVLLDDERPVSAAETGTGLSPGDLGRTRQTAVADLLRTMAPGIRTGSMARANRDPDLVITVSADVVDPELGLRLTSTGLPQLPVVLREADALVGPLARPGVGCCQRCVELARADRDPHWPRVLGLLAAGRRSTREPVVLATVAGGLAAAEAVTLMDSGQPVTTGRQYEVALPRLEPRLREWAAHPDCGCAALPVTEPGPTL